jgi:hypothetical protein
MMSLSTVNPLHSKTHIGLRHVTYFLYVKCNTDHPAYSYYMRLQTAEITLLQLILNNAGSAINFGIQEFFSTKVHTI